MSLAFLATALRAGSAQAADPAVEVVTAYWAEFPWGQEYANVNFTIVGAAPDTEYYALIWVAPACDDAAIGVFDEFTVGALGTIGPDGNLGPATITVPESLGPPAPGEYVVMQLYDAALTTPESGLSNCYRVFDLWGDDDGDGLTGIEELDAGTDPWIPDSDGDGIPDGTDPSTVRDVVDALPSSAFASRGHRTALLQRLDNAENAIEAGDVEGAITKLQALRKHFDGCDSGGAPDANDWITDCAAQATILDLIDALLANLGA